MKPSLLLAAMLITAQAFALSAKSGDLLKRENGTYGVDRGEAAKNVVDVCEGDPLIRAKLAELVSVEEMEFTTTINGSIFANAKCVLKVK